MSGATVGVPKVHRTINLLCNAEGTGPAARTLPHGLSLPRATHGAQVGGNARGGVVALGSSGYHRRYCRCKNTTFFPFGKSFLFLTGTIPVHINPLAQHVSHCGSRVAKTSRPNPCPPQCLLDYYISSLYKKERGNQLPTLQKIKGCKMKVRRCVMNSRFTAPKRQN